MRSKPKAMITSIINCQITSRRTSTAVTKGPSQNLPQPLLIPGNSGLVCKAGCHVHAAGTVLLQILRWAVIPESRSHCHRPHNGDTGPCLSVRPPSRCLSFPTAREVRKAGGGGSRGRAGGLPALRHRPRHAAPEAMSVCEGSRPTGT